MEQQYPAIYSTRSICESKQRLCSCFVVFAHELLGPVFVLKPIPLMFNVLEEPPDFSLSLQDCTILYFTWSTDLGTEIHGCLPGSEHTGGTEGTGFKSVKAVATEQTNLRPCTLPGFGLNTLAESLEQQLGCLYKATGRAAA